MKQQQFNTQKPPKPQVQAPKSVDQYLQDLDALLKRNTGQGMFVGEDVSSNVPMYIPGKVRNPGGIGESAPSISQYGNGMTAPTPVERQKPMQEQPQEEGPSQLEQFLQQFNESVYPSQFGDTTPYQSNGIATTSDGGSLGSDGVVRYADGTIRENGDPSAFSIASMQDGSIQYSDGSVRRKAPTGLASLRGSRERILMDNGSAQYGRYEPTASANALPGGLQGLVSGIFGQDRPITQEYGNVNPIEPTPGHINYGTDIRTKDLTGSQRDLKLPVGARVVQVLRDDGTRFGDRSGHKGYGNSLLVQLPSGEMIRMSHLSSMIDVQPGDEIPAGTVFGTPGKTGNTTGEHLDLEYYDQNGQISNPGQFSGLTNPESFRQAVAGQPEPGTRADISDLQLPAANQPQASQQPQIASQAPVQAPSPKQKTIGQVLGTTTEGPKLTPQEQNVQTADSLAGLGTKAGLPETGLNELVASQGTNPIRQLAGNAVDILSTPLKKVGLPDTGFSELIAGGKTTNTDERLAPGAFAYDETGSQVGSKAPSAPDYANVFKTNLKDAGKYVGDQVSSALAKAGQGVQSLAGQGVASLENVFKPDKAEATRAIGDVPGTVDASGNPNFSSLMDTANSKAGTPKNDVRDSFFKMGGADIYKDFIKQGGVDNSGGALSMDLFSDNFYSDLGRVSSVFGGSKDLDAATEKYVNFEKQKYQPMSKLGYNEGYDRSEVDDFNREVEKYNSELEGYFGSIRSSVKGVPSSFTPNAPSSAKNIFASSAPSSRVMATPSINRSSVQAPKLASINRPSQARPQNYSQAPKSSAPIYGPASRVAPKPVAKQVPQQLFTPAKANASSMRGPIYSAAPRSSAPKPQSKPVSNVFSRAKSFVSNIFRR